MDVKPEIARYAINQLCANTSEGNYLIEFIENALNNNVLNHERIKL